MDKPGLRYVFEHLKKADSFKNDWCRLERVSNASFFLSWQWISNWVEVLKPELHLCKVYFKEQLVGLGLFTSNDIKRHKILAVKQIRLHSTGNIEKDQLWPEYNGMLVETGYEESVYKGLIHFLEKQKDIVWEEFVLGPVKPAVSSLLTLSNTRPYVYWEALTYQVDLQLLREKKLPYIESLSKNTRQQIRRSINHYKNQGKLVITRAQNEEQALDFFKHIAPIHKQRWQKQSGFHNDTFVKFHQHLISNSFDSGAIEMIRLDVSGNVIGYLYNFIFNKKVYFYLSGIISATENKLKPGLVLHAMCIQNHLEEGVELYDFLGGDAQYKKSLSNKVGSLNITYYQKKSLKLQFEQKARQIKNYLLPVERTN